MHREGNNEEPDEDRGIIGRWENTEFFAQAFGFEFFEKPAHSADGIVTEREVCGRDRSDHGHEEEDEIGEKDSAQSTERGKNNGDESGVEKAFPRFETEHDAADFDGRERDGRHDHDVKNNSEINGPEAAEEGGGLAGVTEFIEFDIGRNAAASPQLGVDEDGEHPRE